MNKHNYEVVLVTHLEESSNEMAYEKAFAKKAQTFFWFPVKDIKIPDIFFLNPKNLQSGMVFSNCAHRFTTPYYLDVTIPLKKTN